MNTYLQDFLDHLYDHDKSEQTIRAYLSDLSTFRHWLESQVDESFSPQIITPLDIVNYRKWLKENGKKSTKSTGISLAYPVSVNGVINPVSYQVTLVKI